MERYERIVKKVEKMGHRFYDVHECGYPTNYTPVNLYFGAFSGVRFYIGQGFDKGNEWRVDFSYDPSVRMRSDFQSIGHIPTEKKMLQIVHDVLEGKYKDMFKETSNG